MPFAPGDLSFFIPFTALINSFQVIELSRWVKVSRCLMNVRASGDTSRWLLNTRMQWGWKMLMFSLSFSARFPLSIRSDIGFCLSWLLLLPSSHCRIAFHGALQFDPESSPILSARFDRYLLFAVAIVMFHILFASLSSVDFVNRCCSLLHSRSSFSSVVTLSIVGWISSLLISNQSVGVVFIFVAVACLASFTQSKNSVYPLDGLCVDVWVYRSSVSMFLLWFHRLCWWVPSL